MKQAIAILSVLFLFFACNDRETDYTYNPALDFTVDFEKAPIFEDDILTLSITLQQEDGENFGAYAIQFHKDADVGKINFENGKEITQEWSSIPYGTTALYFKGITKGDHSLTLRIKDPYGKVEEKSYTIKVLSKGDYTPFASAHLFIKQQFEDIWGIQNPTAQQIAFWQVQLESNDETKKIDRNDVLVSFINNQTTKDRLDIHSESLRNQIQRAYLTLLQRPVTMTEIDGHIKAGDGFKVIVGRIFRSEAYQDRFNTGTSILNFTFTPSDNPVLLAPFTPTITGNTITGILPVHITLTTLNPQITIPVGATIAPEANTPQDFSTPVTYTVTAINGETRNYTITLQNEVKFTEIGVLKKLYITNPQSQSLLAWDLTNTDICSWHGVRCTDGKVSTLELSSMQLTSIPSEIGQLHRLTELQLDYNELSTLPNEIGYLQRLLTLNLASNRLLSLPPEIKGLTQLKYLNLEANSLRALPPEIGALKALGELHLKTNELNALPSQIGQLTRLEILDLNNNALNELPLQIGQLHSLQYLYLRDNNIEVIPPQIGELTNLTRLFLDENNITHIPPEIGRLTNLNFLTLCCNRLDNLPPNLGNLTELTWLSIKHNKFREVPSAFWKLIKMTHLFLHENQIESIPPDIAKLTKLVTILLQENELEALPQEIGTLTNLNELNITDNPLITVPQTICDLQIPNVQFPNGSNFCN